MPMSPRKFEEIADEYEREGLDVSDLRAAWEASPLRKERDDLRKQAEANLERARKAEQKALSGSFKDMGIKVSPTALRLPDDLDVTDDEALRAWAVKAQLIDPPAPQETDPAEVKSHQNAAAAASGATTPSPVADLNERIAKAQSPAEVMALVKEAGIPTTEDG